MGDEISAALYLLVAERAKYRCEYCLLPEAAAFHNHEPAHIIPLQHGPPPNQENLVFVCFRCNRYKGPNVGWLDPVTQILTPLFDPRSQQCSEHFKLTGARIEPKTAEGRVTVDLLRFNEPARLAEREKLMLHTMYSV